MCQPHQGATNAAVSNVTGFDVFRQLTSSVEVRHLNTAAGAVVITFLFVQFRALLRSIVWPEVQRSAQRQIILNF